MNQIQKIIDKLSTDGVEYKKIGDVCDYEQPTKYIVESTKYDDGYETPVLTAGQTFILGYTDEKEGIYQASKENPVIIFDDFTGAFKWVDFPFKVKSSAMKIITAKKDIPIRYIYHLMGNLNFSSAEHKRLWISIYSQFEIPLPPLAVQRKIVDILDKFTSLEAELEAELEARKKQYAYYRDLLLSFDTPGAGVYSVNPQSTLGTLVRRYCPAGVEWKKLGEVCTRQKGTPITASNMKKLNKENAPIRIFAGGNTMANIDYGDIPERDIITKTSIIVKSRGNIGFEYYEKPFSHKNEMWSYSAKNEDINLKFVYYFLQSHVLDFQKKAKTGKLPQISTPDTDNFLIPLPPLPVQEEIVRILDRFDALCHDLTAGIPAEIAARKKQYEYYRDLLLSFPPRRTGTSPSLEEAS